jgi:uncharacterized membrane protein
VELITALTVGSGVAFLGYGVHCLFSKKMREEFDRFDMASLRLLTGWLEIAGGLGLLVGFSWRAVQPIAAGGLSLLMLCGLAVRVRQRDDVRLAVPATMLMLVNGYIMLDGIRCWR